MKIKRLGLVGATVLALAAVLPLSAAAGGAQHVRWDIISLVGGGAPGPINPGGTSFATAPDGDTITLTGTGTFVAPAGNNGGSGAVTGGGTWDTSLGGSGSYQVMELVSWVFANSASPTPVFVDNIGPLTARANGTAVLRVLFSDGESGVITVGCHGPGAPDGIFEGVAVTKGYKTYYVVGPTLPGIDLNRTLFHFL